MSLFDRFRKKRKVTREKGYEVYPASKRATEWDEIHFKGRDVKFGGKPGNMRSFYTKDAGFAREMKDYLGQKGTGDVVVCEVDNPGAESPRKSFIINAPWKKEK